MPILSSDLEARIWETVDYDEIDDRVVIRRYQDVEPFLEANKRLQNADYASRRGEWMRHVAAIPDIIVNKWLIEDGINALKKEHWPAVRRKLNDPDWRWLRTHHSHL